MERRLALLIATYQYEDARLRQLISPAHDAEALSAVLQDPDIAGFEVTTLINEPHHVVGEAIGDFYRDRRRGDLTLLYFTGHGLKDENGRLYLAMANTRKDSLLFTSLSAEQIDQAMEGCTSRQKMLILDCCYSGAYPVGRIAKADTQVHTLERFQGRGRTVLTASDATQYSFEGDQPHGEGVQSVFTRNLVAGLRDGSADLDGDGDITLDELYSYVHDRVVEEMPQQRPKKQDNVQGRTIIARNVNWSLPIYLHNAIGSPIAADRLGALDALIHLHRIGNPAVRSRVASEIRRLADDDSRTVSAAATAHLSLITRSQPESASPPPPAPRRPSKSDSAPAPVSVSRRSPETVSENVVPTPVAKPAPTASLPEAADEPSPPATSTAASVPKPSEKGLSSRRSDWDLLAVVTGCLAILAAAELAFVGVTSPSNFSYGRFPYSWYIITLVYPWYVTVLAALAFIAGVLVLLPRSRPLIGPGIAIGAATAATWGTFSYVSGMSLNSEGGRFWIGAAGYLSLLVTAALAAFMVRRQGSVSIELRLPRNLPTGVAVLLGSVGMVTTAWVLTDEVLVRAPGNHSSFWLAGLARAYIAVIVLAFNVPLLAALIKPRRLGLAVLAGWTGGSCAIPLTTGGSSFVTDTSRTIVLAGSLLLLLAATGIAARWSSD